MKTLTKLLFSGILILTFFACNEEKTVTEPEEAANYSKEIKEFFPANIGDSFEYSVDTLDQISGEFKNVGSRATKVLKLETTSGNNTFLCNEDYSILGKQFQKESKFKITSHSLEFYADTNGVSALIPDSIEVEIKLVLDESFKIVEFPLVKGKEWKVYNGSANFGTFKFSILDVVGQYIDSETLNINGLSKEVQTEKFKYTISLNIPDIQNPFLSDIQNYEAVVWFAPGRGVVKIEGCKLFINPITGNGFDVADSNKIVRHTLVF